MVCARCLIIIDCHLNFWRLLTLARWGRMKALSVVKWVFLMVGAVLVAIGALSYKKSSDFLAEAISTEGTIIAFARLPSTGAIKPVVQFLDREGATVEFTSPDSVNDKYNPIGTSTEVVYSPADPQGARIKSFLSRWRIALPMLLTGSPFLLTGIGMLLVGRLKIRKINHLRQQGQVVHANYQSVDVNHSYSINGRHPYLIVCQWLNPTTRVLHRLESDNIWFDPTPYISSDKIKVFIDRQNPRKYHVDLSFLPESAD